MKTIQLKLTLQEPLVISQSNATEGAHQSLDYIPGGALLGAIAAKHYAALKKENLAYEVFHSGKVRFLNAYPWIKEEATKPIPLCLHYDKLGDKKQPINYLHKTYSNGVQGKQHRQGYVATQSNYFYEPEKTLQMRTAIDPGQGTAKEGQLFGYQMLQAGEVFVAQINCDDEQLADLLHEKLALQKEILIGRSRSAQYGRVSLEVLPEKHFQATPPIMKIKDSDYLVLWLASDMAVYDQNGQPTLSPSLTELGLSEWGEFDSAKSYIRTRKYAPYNAYRRSYDLERQVLTKGSILSYKLNKSLSEQDVQLLSKGLGAYTESGLGQVVLGEAFNFLTNDEFSFEPEGEREKHSISSKKVNKQHSHLLQYLQQRKDEMEGMAEYAQKIEEELEELKKRYLAARKYHGITHGIAFGPTKSQWGIIREEARNSKDKKELLTKLFDSNDGKIRPKDDHWSISNGQEAFDDYLKALVNKFPPKFIQLLALKVTQNKELLNVMEGKR